MRPFYATTLFLTLLALLSVGCSHSTSTLDTKSTEAAESAVTLANAVCPIMGGKAKDTVTVEWNGKTVGFCCPDCIADWNGLSEEDKAAKLAAAASENPAEPSHDSNHGSVTDDAS